LTSFSFPGSSYIVGRGCGHGCSVIAEQKEHG
jgi:hypothetical protein